MITNIGLTQVTHPMVLSLERLQKNDLNEARLYADSLLLSKGIDNMILKSEVMLNLSNTLRMMGDLDSALIVADRVPITKINSVSLITRQLLCKANIFEEQGEFDQAMLFYLKAIDLAKTYDLKADLGLVYNDLGGTFLYKNNFEEAKVYLNMALKIREELSDSLRIGKTLNNLGALHRRVSEFDSARYYYNRSILIKEGLNDIRDLNSTYLNIAILDQVEGKRIEAIKVYEKVIQSALEIQDYEMVILGQINRANAYLALGDYRRAEVGFYEALDYSVLYENKVSLTKIYLALAIISEEKGDATDVLKFRRLYHENYTELYSLEKEKEVSRLQAKFNVIEKDREIVELNRARIESQLKIKQEELNTNRKLFWIYLIGSILIFSLFFLVLIYNRKRIHTRKLNVLLKEREILLKEVHHRVKNNLQIVSSLLSIQSNLSEDVNPKEILLNAQNRIQSIALIHEKLYQTSSLVNVKLNTYFEQLIQHLSQSYNLQANGIVIEHDLKSVPMHLDKIVPCGLIINELITNSIKHAFRKGGIIRIRCNLENNIVLIDVEDNGIGFSENFELSTSHSFGLKLANGLAKQLKGNLNLIEPTRAHFQLKINL